ncbi:zinc metalloprotease [Actinomadura harenae]|uniref:Uncharacterized protein n=1 Tax=Actinomadura harenae TaxID=2483351 RepID=A0A3M2M545_9ACTN|nr:hypothetical protein [Actinomadura harenae]RMI43943.1 hypothetical protein EBO15_14690 [Actinomadura harenae]
MGFMRIKNTGFSAAMAYPIDVPNWWGAMFIRGDQLAMADSTGYANGGGLRYNGPINGDTWVGFGRQPLPEPYRSACEGALMLPSLPGTGWAQMLLFKENRAYWYQQGAGKFSEGPVTDLARGGPTWGAMLPQYYLDQVDALLMDTCQEGSAWQTYVFKGDRVATLDWVNGCTRDCTILEGAQPTPGWAMLAPEWSSDFDHVLMLPTSRAFEKRSLLVKGANGCVFNWNTGPERVGALTTLMPQLGPLPAPFTTQYRPVSGRWAVNTPTYSFVVRVDLDGNAPTYTLSGDVFTINGGTQSYASSFRGKASVTASATELVATCTPTWTSASPATSVKVVVPRTAAGADAPTARVEMPYSSGGSYSSGLAFQSPYFRTIELETDAVAGKQIFSSYDTTTAPVPPGYRNRIVSVASAYADAGIEMSAAAATPVQVDASEAGSDLLWSDSELHAAMVAHFAGYADTPQWKLWAFVASTYFDPSKQGPGSAVGVMFDSTGRNRQGMAVFYDSQVSGGEPGTREEPHTWVHELGHALNLAHSWDKARVGDPLGPRNGYGDLSWMNYSHLYQFSDTVQGSAAFWARFRFGFTANELVHLRHGFYNDVVPGGADFFSGSTAKDYGDSTLATMSEPLIDRSGLSLTLSARPFLYGEPVAVEVKLTRTGRDVQVHPDLSPTSANLKIAIVGPSGTTRVFRPLTGACGGHNQVVLTTLTTDRPALYGSAYLGSGADGQYFTDPGLYRVRALYTAPDGSKVASNTLEVRVRLPLTPADQDAGELLMGEQAGLLMSLLGSDSPTLRSGNDALTELSSRFPDHPLAVYSHLAQGANAGRHYQSISEGRIRVRRPDTKNATDQLSAAIEASTGPAGLNNLALNSTMRRLARVQAKAGDLDLADRTLTRMVDYFRAQHVPPHVLADVRSQADTTRRRLTPDQHRTPKSPRKP